MDMRCRVLGFTGLSPKVRKAYLPWWPKLDNSCDVLAHSPSYFPDDRLILCGGSTQPLDTKS